MLLGGQQKFDTNTRKYEYGTEMISKATVIKITMWICCTSNAVHKMTASYIANNDNYWWKLTKVLQIVMKSYELKNYSTVATHIFGWLHYSQ